MCKPLSLEDLKDLNLFKKNQTEISGTVAYLIGVKDENMYQFFSDNPEDYDKLKRNDNAVIIRCLNLLRTKLLTNYRKTEDAFRYDLQNLDRMDLYQDEVKILKRKGVEIIQANYRVNKYIVDINNLIAARIDGCRLLFPDWVEWKYIKQMFIMPNGQKEDKIIVESNKFNLKRTFYPFGFYINWDAQDEGNVLISDKKFLSALYSQNQDYFSGISKVTDASDNVKANIYDFIEKNQIIDIVVDCENSDAYRLYSTLKGLDDEKLSKINKIVLFDDVHTTSAWKLLTERFTDIVNFDYVLVERLNDNKSLVDHKMIAEIAKEYYKNDVDGFIVVSSDSDYWAIIDSIPEAQFLVMVEKEKVGYDIREALDKKGIFYCFINDFCSSKTGEFENAVLNTELKKRLENVLDINAKELLKAIYTAARIEPSETEKNSFYEKHVKTLKLVINPDGSMKIC